MRKLKKTLVREFEKRWAAVDAAQAEELRVTPKSLKLRQLVALMSSAEQLGWKGPSAAEAKEIRARWKHLRRTLRG